MEPRDVPRCAVSTLAADVIESRWAAGGGGEKSKQRAKGATRSRGIRADDVRVCRARSPVCVPASSRSRARMCVCGASRGGCACECRGRARVYIYVHTVHEAHARNDGSAHSLLTARHRGVSSPAGVRRAARLSSAGRPTISAARGGPSASTPT